MTPRRERKNQYEQTGERIGGFLGRVIAFMAPFTAIIPKAVWGWVIAGVMAVAGYTTAELTTDPIRGNVGAQDSINTKLLEGINEIKGTMSDGFNQMADRQDNFERVVTLVAARVGVDKEIKRERRRRQYQDSLRHDLFPREPVGHMDTGVVNMVITTWPPQYGNIP